MKLEIQTQTQTHWMESQVVDCEISIMAFSLKKKIHKVATAQGKNRKLIGFLFCSTVLFSFLLTAPFTLSSPENVLFHMHKNVAVRVCVYL